MIVLDCKYIFDISIESIYINDTFLVFLLNIILAMTKKSV